ncbi:MAG: hypothetical protein OEX81_04165 [Candidatus Pacebacteria bacterium]|nr:hypothetical protein [Candidatus Paceibacterota bacterium]
MTVLLKLFLTDFKQASFWLKKHTIAKILVSIASLLLLTGLVNILFWGSYSYFWSISPYQPYGKLTAIYALHSGLIITAWFVFLSSFIQIFRSIIKPSKELIYLMGQPVKPITISLWISFRAWIINTFLMLIFWLPVTFSYNLVFGEFSTTSLITNIVLITSVITAAIQVTSTFISLIVTPLLKGHESWLAAGGTISFLGISWGLIGLVFPQSLRELIRIDIDKFDQLFSNLPLNQNWVITRKIIQFLETTQISYLVLPIIFFLILIIVGIFINQFLLIKSWQRVLAKAYNRHPLSPPIYWWYQKPHIIKETLLMIRDHSERNSFFFFLGLLGFFFFFLQRSLNINQDLSQSLESLTAFSLGAVLFISTAFLLRIVFPLLTKEGHSAWYLLRECHSGLEVHQTKATYAKLLIGLLFVLVNLGWLLMPLSKEIKLSLIVYSSFGVILLGWLNTVMGLMMTEWEKGDNPEQISTSGTGILTLIISLIIITGIVSSYLKVIPYDWNITLSVLSLGIILAIHRFSEAKSQKYQYPQNWD